MVEKSSFLGCFNPCKFGLQNFSVNQVRPAGFGLFEQAFPNDMGDCEECKLHFNIFRRKKLCNDCGLSYCSACLTRMSNGHRQCKKCKILMNWPINKADILSLRVRDLRHFLSTCKISTSTYKEKQELVDLVVVQLKIQHGGRYHDYQRNFPINTATTSTTSTTSSTNPTSTTTRDDGIRVRPHTFNYEDVIFPTTSATATAGATSFSFTVQVDSPEDPDNDTAGIRVFPFMPAAESDTASSSDPQPDTHQHEQSDDTSSSSWSLLQPDEMHISSSSDSLMSHSGSENPSDNIPLDEDVILQEVNVPSTNPEGGGAGASENTPQQNVPSGSESKLTCVADVIKLSSLADEDAIKELSVRQCKEILILHRVDFSGVWEKHELVNKVIMLWKDFKEREGERDWSEDQLCKICMDAPIDCVLLECGHMMSCTSCGKRLAECPICRQNVIRVVKTFRA